MSFLDTLKKYGNYALTVVVFFVLFLVIKTVIGTFLPIIILFAIAGIAYLWMKYFHKSSKIS